MHYFRSVALHNIQTATPPLQPLPVVSRDTSFSGIKGQQQQHSGYDTLTTSAAGGISFFSSSKVPFSNTNNQQLLQVSSTTTKSLSSTFVPTPSGKQWKTKALNKIQALPMYYPLHPRNSMTFDGDLDTLLDRISCVCKCLNLHAQYDPSLESFGLLLKSHQDCELSLVLWLADDDTTSSSQDNEILVEINKRRTTTSGSCCVGDTQAYITRILQALQQKPEDPIRSMSNDRTLSNGVVPDDCYKIQMLLHQKVEEQQQQQSSTAASIVDSENEAPLKMVQALLKSDTTTSMGLEILSNLADPRKVTVESAVSISQMILLGRSKSTLECGMDIHNKVIKYFQEEEANESTVTCPQVEKCMNLALLCLVHALETQSKLADTNIDGSASGLSVSSAFLAQAPCNILEILLSIVRCASSKPHCAFLAVKALYLLASDCPAIRDAVESIMTSSVERGEGSSTEDVAQRCAVLHQAHQVGVQSHQLLEVECNRLWSVLESRL